MKRMLLALLVVGVTVSGNAQTRRDYDLFTDPGGRFSVEFPRDWKWSLVSPSGEALATFVQPGGEAAVIVERFRLKQRLLPKEITALFVEVEVDHIKESQPRAADVMAQLVPDSSAPMVVIDYTRPGVNDRVRERVRQYSKPLGQNLYRITCAARFDSFARYEATFASIAETLKPAVEK